MDAFNVEAEWRERLNCKANKASTQIGYCFSLFLLLLLLRHAFHVAPPLFCNIHAFFDALSVLLSTGLFDFNIQVRWKISSTLFVRPNRASTHNDYCSQLLSLSSSRKRWSIKVIDLPIYRILFLSIVEIIERSKAGDHEGGNNHFRIFCFN